MQTVSIYFTWCFAGSFASLGANWKLTSTEADFVSNTSVLGLMEGTAFVLVVVDFVVLVDFHVLFIFVGFFRR